VLFALAPISAAAQERGSIEGFGGLSLNGLTSETPLSLGGTATVSLTPNVQIVGEGGRLANVMPLVSNAVFQAARLDLQASALYVEGGMRLTLSPTSVVTPYGEAIAGIAGLNITSGRLSLAENTLAALGLGLVGRTMPAAGLGAGLLVRGGPVVLDLGYRYQELFASDLFRATLGLGEPLRANEVRFGVGVRF